MVYTLVAEILRSPGLREAKLDINVLSVPEDLVISGGIGAFDKVYY